MFGAIILGDASVSANIVSPILVIIVAITGITAFAVPDFSLSFHVRIVRFLYIVLGYFAGFLGIAFCFVTHITILASINSFGVSYLSPFAPISKDNNSRIFPTRRNFLNTKRPIKEEKISRRWKF